MDNKVWYKSVGIWGSIISVAGKILAAKFGFELTEGQSTELATILAASGSLVGDAMAFVGRVRANSKITLTSK